LIITVDFVAVALRRWSDLRRSSRCSGPAAIEAYTTTAECDHVQQTASYRDVLEEMDELILVAEMVVKNTAVASANTKRTPAVIRVRSRVAG